MGGTTDGGLLTRGEARPPGPFRPDVQPTPGTAPSPKDPFVAWREARAVSDYHAARFTLSGGPLPSGRCLGTAGYPAASSRQMYFTIYTNREAVKTDSFPRDPVGTPPLDRRALGVLSVGTLESTPGRASRRIRH